MSSPIPNPRPSAPASHSRVPRIALAAGELSGDNLGAALIEALRERLPTARFYGVAGPRMIAAGCEAWEDAESLAVMGVFEVLPHLPRLLRLRRTFIQRLLADPPDVYVGVDAKEFNLSVAKRLKTAGLRTVQYVSPQVWAWRQGRVKKIAEAVDLMLCLLPFEEQFYDERAVNARFVGHPLADQIPFEVDREAARKNLNIANAGRCVAVLPGSRQDELARLSPDFAATIAWLSESRPQLSFVAPMANAAARATFNAALVRAGVAQRVLLVDGEQAQTALAASDAVLVASGTATLETLLVNRPMVVAYRLGALTTFLLRDMKLMKAPFFSQPNLLAGRRIVPEYFNDAVRADVLGPAVLGQLDRSDLADMHRTFADIHRTLRRDASRQAAAAIVELLSHAPGNVRVGASGK
jgi:lipid-A-disaccharide synthase